MQTLNARRSWHSRRGSGRLWENRRSDCFLSRPRLDIEQLETRALLAVVSGTFFTDLDGTSTSGFGAPDGIRNAADTGRINETVELFTSPGDLLVDTQLTDADGLFQFNAVADGSYYLRFVEPKGAFFTDQDVGMDDTIDSDADPSDGTTTVFSVMGADSVSFDAGAVNEFSPAGFEYLLSQFGASLQNLLIQSEELEDSVSGVSLVGESGIPFIEDALSGVVNFTSTFNEIGNQLFDSAELTLTSAPDVSFDLSADARLLVTLSGSDPVDVTVPMSMHTDINELIMTVDGALATAGLDTDIVTGENDGNLTLSTIDNDLGTTLRVGTLRITAPNPAPAFGQPLADVEFDLTIDSVTTTLSLPATPTTDADGNPLPTSQDNATPEELADDLNELFVNAGLSEITALIGTSGELVIAATGPEVGEISITDCTNLDLLGLASASADTNQGALDMGFRDGMNMLVGGRGAAGFRFNSIESLVIELDQALQNVADPGTGVSLGAVFDDATESLLFTLGLGQEYSQAISLDFSEGIDLGALGTLEVAGGADATFVASATLDFRAGFDLSGLGSSFSLSNATPLSDLNSGEGVALNVGITAAMPAPSDGQLGSDANVAIIIDGQPAVVVPVTAAATAGNADEFALADDLNEALADAGLDSMLSAGTVTDGGEKITLTAIDSAIRSLRVESADALGFAMAGQDGDRADLEIFLKSGDNFLVNLDGSNTIGDVINAIEQQSMDMGSARVLVTINADQTGLVLTDQTMGSETFEVKQPGDLPGFPPIAGFGLGILKTADPATDDTIDGDTLHGETLLDRFFIVADESGLSFDVNVDAANIGLTAALSFLEIGLENGTLDFDITTGIDFTDPDSSGRITLTELFDSPLADLFDLRPLTATGSAELPLSDSVFQLVAPDYDTGTQNPAIEASLMATVGGDDFEFSLGANADLQTVFEDVIAQFSDFGIDDLVVLLSNLADTLLDSDLPLLNEQLPLIDQSVGDVIGFADSILDAVAELGTLMDVDDLNAAADAVETGISNLTLAPADKVPFVDTLDSMREAISGDEDRRASRIVSAAGRMQKLIDALPANTLGDQDLQDALQAFVTNVPAIDSLAGKLADILKDALGITDSDVFDLTLNFADYDDNTTAIEPALVLGFDYSQDFAVSIAPELNTGAFGPLSFEGNADLAMVVSPNFQVGIGLALAGGVTPFLMVNPTGSLPTTSLGVEVGFTSRVDGEVQFGGLELVQAGGTLNLTAAEFESFTDGDLVGNNLTLTETPLDEALVLVATAATASGPYTVLTNDVDYTVAGNVITFDTAPVGVIDVEYLSLTTPGEPSMDEGEPPYDFDAEPEDRASLSIGFDQSFIPSDSNTIGAAPITELFGMSGPSFDLVIDGLITAQLDASFLGNTQEGVVTLVTSFNHFDPQLAVDTDALTDLFTELELDLETIVIGTGALLDLLEAGLTSEVIAQLPVIGEGLDASGTFIGKLRDNLVTPLETLLADVDGTLETVAGLVQFEVFNALNPLGIILDRDDSGMVDENDVSVTLTQDTFEIDLSLGGRDEISTGIDFDLGLDGIPLGIEANGGVDFSWDWQVDFGIGLSRDTGFYFLVNEDDTPEVRLTLNTGLVVDDSGIVPVPTSFEVDLFGLGLTATDNLNDMGDDGNTGVTGELSLDVKGFDEDSWMGEDDGRLTIQEIDDNSVKDIFTAGIDVDAVIDLGLAVEVSAALPSIEADLLVDFGVAFDTVDGLTFNAPTFALNDITLNLGDFLSNVIKPIVEDVDEAIEPIKPLIKFLKTEVPGISQLSQASGDGPVTVLDLAFIQQPAQGRAAKQFISVVDQIFEVVELLNSFDEGDNIAINLGSFSVDEGDVPDLATNPNGLSSIDDTQLAGILAADGAVTDFGAVQTQIDNSSETKVNSTFSKINRSAGFDTDGGLGLELSIIQDPANVFKLLLGQTANIVVWDIPVFALGFTYEKDFRPIAAVPPLTVTVGADFDFFADLTVGLDTRGLQTGNFLDGFFFGDLEGEEDIPEFGIGIGVRLRAALDLLVASAGIEGELRADVFANWNDQDDDGKLYGDELARIVQRDGFDCIFNLTGELRAIVRLVWEVFGSEGSKEFIDVLLFSFMNECPKIELGHVVEMPETMSDGSTADPGTLVLHAGPNASLRQKGVSSDTDEAFTITRIAPGVISVVANGIEDRYSGVESIYFDGGEGNDFVELVDDLGANMLPSILIGGSGDDELIGNTGVDDIRGGSGNDIITAGDSDDIISGGSGMDTIDAGDGADVIDAGDGADIVMGGDGGDTINGGEGADIIDAGIGMDTIDGGAGNDDIMGGADNDTIMGGGGADMIDAGMGDDTVSGGSGNDTIFGRAGLDTLSGDSGNDFLQGDEDADTIMGGLGSDALIGNLGSDILLGGWGNDVILANDASGPEGGGVTHYIEGGPDDDFICGDDGVDTIFGGTAEMGLIDVASNQALFPSSNGYSVSSCLEVPVFASNDPVTIRGQKFDDANQNGLRDAGETGINGWTIELFDEQNQLVDRALTADVDLDGDGKIDPVTESGIYIFMAEPGSYTVQEVVDPQWLQSFGGGVSVLDAAVHPTTGLTYAITRSGLYTIDAAGAGTRLGSLGGARLNSIDFASDGTLYGMGYSDSSLYSINTGNGSTSALFDTGFTSAGGLAHLDDVLYTTTGNRLVRLDPTLQTAEVVGAHGIGGMIALGVNGDDDLIAARSATDTYVLNIFTGEATPVAVVPSGELVEFGTLAFGQTVIVPAANANALDYEVLLLSGQAVSGLDFGNYFAPATITGQKFEDLDGDGVRDANELGLDDFIIQLFDAQGLLVGEATTASVDLNGDGDIDAFTEQGLYTFENLDAGDYELVEVPQAGWVQSLPAMDEGIMITVGNDEVSTDNDFGNYRPVQIHGQKFEDLDGDGVRDPGELGLNGWTIQLFDNMGGLVTTQVTMDMDLNGDGTIDPATESGLYWFTDLAPGTYMVSEVLQMGWVQTTLGGTTSTSQSVLYAVSTGLDGDSSSSLVRLDSFNDSPVAVEVGESGTLLTDVAIDPTTGRIFAIDYNRLYELDGDTGEATLVRTLIGGPLNALEFSDTGELFVMGHDRLFQVNTDGTNQTTLFNTGVTSTGDLAYDSDGTMYLAAGQKLYRFDLTAGTFTLIGTHGIRALFGLESTGLGQFLIGGDETGRLHLLNKSTAEVQRLSFPSGNRNLGINGLTFDGNVFTAGTPGTLDYTATLFSGDVLDGADFGNQQTTTVPPSPLPLGGLGSVGVNQEIHLPTDDAGPGKLGIISGVKFHDFNMNGIRDPEEPGLSDWRIFLDLNGDGEWDDMTEPGTLTAIDGGFSFENLAEGTYIVAEQLQLGWVQSAPATGTYTVPIAAGTVFNAAIFGNYQLDFNTIVDGDDTIFGLADNDIIFGDNDTGALISFGLVDGFDTISGGGGNDTMHGQGRDDVFEFEPTTILETDTVHELDGEGSDTLSFATLTSGDAVTVNLTMDAIASHTNRTVNTGAAGQAAFFENIIGGLGNDSLTGNAANNKISGGDGDDSMTGLTGDDWYIFLAAASSQTDTVTEQAGEGIDRLDFQALSGLDPVTVDLANMALATHTNRTVNTGAGMAANFEDAFGGGAGDMITGNASANLLVGGAGADTITGAAGSDTIRGGAGDDMLEGGADDDLFIVRRGDGSDTVTDSGGMGDEIDLTDMRLDLVFNVTTGSFTVTDGVETLTHTGDTIDLVRSGRGDDRVVFTNDTASLIAQIDAGLGIDLLDYTALSAAAGVVVNLDTGAAARTGGVVAFENVDGGEGADMITGDANANQLRGFGGDDNIMGLAGADVLEGGAGNDTLAGGEDDDLFVFVDPVMTENDAVVEMSNEGDDTLDFSALTAGFGLTLDLALAGAQAIHTDRTLSVSVSDGVNNVVGTTDADMILGNAAANRLMGGGGSDTLGGRDGSDVLIGGADDDTYVFEDAASAQTDTIVESLGGGVDTLDFTALTTNVTFDMLIQSDLRATNLTIDMQSAGGADGTSFFENILGSLTAVNELKGNNVDNVITGGNLGDTLEGRRGMDTLNGGDGDDTLRGGRGEDTLRGGADNDTLDGGPNQDRFVFDSQNDGSDTVLENSGAVNLGGALGGGGDILDLSGVTTPVTFDLTMDMGTRATDIDVAFQTADMMVMFASSNVETIIGSSTATNMLTGNDADNTLTGGSVADVLNGGDGADLLSGGDGDDTLGGGGGNDLLMGGTGDDQLSGNGGDDILLYDASDVTLIDGGSGDDTLRFELSVALDLSAATQIVGIDYFDFLDAQVQSVDIEAPDVPLATDAAQLRISGGAEDAVTLRGMWSMITSGVMLDGRLYDEYQLADMSAIVLIDQTITTVTLLPSSPIPTVGHFFDATAVASSGRRSGTEPQLAGVASPQLEVQTIGGRADIQGESGTWRSPRMAEIDRVFDLLGSSSRDFSDDSGDRAAFDPDFLDERFCDYVWRDRF